MSEIIKQEMEVKSGWYKATHRGGEKFLIYYDFEKGVKYGINTLGNWFYNDHSVGKWFTYNLIKVTDQEVELILIKGAEKRGFKKGAIFNDKGLDIHCADDNIYLKNNVLYYGCFPIMENGVWAEIVENPIKPIKREIRTVGLGDEEPTIKEVSSPQQHYDNSKGSLYKLANELGLNHYEFDVLRLLIKDKDNLKTNLQDMKKVINLYLDSFDK